MKEIAVHAVPIERLAPLLDREQRDRLGASASRAQSLLAGRTVWNVNATAAGGGVAEMLHSLLAYVRGSGVDTRWLAIDGTPDFFAFTKRLHNRLHGTPGDGGPVDDAQRSVYEKVLETNAMQLRSAVRSGDIVLLHDPQTVGLAGALRRSGARVVWRCHVGRDTGNEHTDEAWDFLRRYVEDAEELVFSRRAYAPGWVDADRLWVIPPSLDPFSPKNCDLSDADVAARLRHSGLTDVHEARFVLQVSRWDHLKDMAGVLRAFSHPGRLPEDVHLVLAGPDTTRVRDDPEGAAVLEECRSLWRSQPVDVRARVHLCALSMDDVEENAHLVNALQRRATVVVQKSLQEGFGLTVTEAMWKSKPVVASRVGGISDQIVHGESGLLLDDPTDLDSFGSLVRTALDDVALAGRLGAAARERVRQHYLGDRHLVQYVELFERLVGG